MLLTLADEIINMYTKEFLILSAVCSLVSSKMKSRGEYKCIPLEINSFVLWSKVSDFVRLWRLWILLKSEMVAGRWGNVTLVCLIPLIAMMLHTFIWSRNVLIGCCNFTLKKSWIQQLINQQLYSHFTDTDIIWWALLQEQIQTYMRPIPVNYSSLKCFC